MKTETIKLNILKSYPVKWSVYAVMRDFVQNFYDAVGYKNFANGFKHKYKAGVLTMKTQSSFDVDWLYYLGASTKRDTNSSCAGGFGEGFKIAALIAYRDLGYEITMASKDWKIKVTEVKEIIDGKTVYCLAYRKTGRKDDGLSVLRLTNVKETDHSSFLSCINDFLYVGNPLLGKCLAFHKGYAIYETKDSTAGGIFARYQMRYSFSELPYVITNPDYKREDDDRDRPMFYSGDARRCTIQTIEKLNAVEAYDFLIRIKEYWNVKGIKKDLNYEHVIYILIKKIKDLPNFREMFYDSYCNEVVADFSYRADPYRKRKAAGWYSQWDGKKDRKIVLNIFDMLGIPDLEELCEQEGGFDEYRNPSSIECRYIDILCRIAMTCFDDLLCYDHFPHTRIIITGRLSTTMGVADIRKCNEKKINKAGIMVKNDISTINIDAELLKKDNFSKAVSTYLHELLHQYGNDSERNFHKALLLMDIRLSEIENKLDSFEKEWLAVDGADR